MKPSINTTLPITHCCPACGLLCDDLVLNSTSLVSIKNACVKSVSFFEKAFAESTSKPSVAGKPTELSNAIQAAANILSKASHPLFAGLGTEVQGMRLSKGAGQASGGALLGWDSFLTSHTQTHDRTDAGYDIHALA